MIPSDLLAKYNMAPLQKYKEDFGDSPGTERMFYETFLVQTDHIPNKMTEAFFETMAGLTLTSFLSDMFGFIRTVYAEYKPILDARTECRMAINRLERGGAGNVQR